MKYLITVALVILVAHLACSITVSTVFERVNVDHYLKNRGLVESHVNCIVYDHRCDRIGLEMKRLLPLIANTRCSICSTEQKYKLGKIASHWQQYYPQAWRDLPAKVQLG